MEPIAPAAVESALARFLDRPVYLHLETTAGAYTENGFGAFVRNACIRLRRAAVRGSGTYRAGLETEDGWIYAEGLTAWGLDAQGRILLAGYDGEGRVTVLCELSATPFPTQGLPARLHPARPSEPVRPGLVPPTAERSVLFVHAHPDDETFGCGGTLALYAYSGVPVSVAIGTRGEMGRNMGKPPFATRETLPALREKELEAACSALGVRDLWLLGVWDKTTEFADPVALADQIGAIIAEVDPSLIITSHPEHGRHPDHCAIAAATLAAVARLPRDRRPRVHSLIAGPAAEQLGLSLQTVDVRPVLDVKERAFDAHRSQSEAMRKRLTPEEAERRRERIASERYVVLQP